MLMGYCINMGSNGATGIQGLTITTALEVARDSEGEVDPTISQYLEANLRAVWLRILAAPDTYILAPDEFSLFNYFKPRFADSELAQNATRRFWNHYRGPNSG
jgi:hypothetical protein